MSHQNTFQKISDHSLCMTFYNCITLSGNSDSVTTAHFNAVVQKQFLEAMLFVIQHQLSGTHFLH
jgi:hypothetical protein